MVAGSYDELARYLTNGYWIDQGDTARSFDHTNITFNVSGLQESDQGFARQACRLWADVCSLTFTETTREADITFHDPEDFDPLDPTSEPYGRSYSDVSNGVIQSSQVYISTNFAEGVGAPQYSYRFQAFIHELGHAIGLGHPGDYNYDGASVNYPGDAIYDNDSWQLSVMSNFNQNVNTTTVGSYAFVLTPQIVDIIAVQTLYKVDQTTRTNDTTYGVDNSSGRASYSADFTDFPTVTIYDSGGFDTLNYSGTSHNQMINLAEGAMSSVYGKTNNIIIARGTVIEAAVGGSGEDEIHGNAVKNSLSGGNGDDTLSGGPGVDTLDGGDGSDTVDYSDNEMFFGMARGGDVGYFDPLAVVYSSGGNLTVDLTKGQAIFVLTGISNGRPVVWSYLEPLKNIENVIGTSGNDIIYGNEFENVITGGPGIDTLDGRGGSDTVSYVGSEGFLWLDLAGQTANLIRTSITPDGPKTIRYTESVANFENAIVGSGGSRIFGTDLRNELTGGAGTDRLTGREGNDILRGEDGDDFLYGGYSPGSGDDAGRNDGADLLEGGRGNDKLYGGSGNDNLTGGAGADYIDGGPGRDTANYFDTELTALHASGVSIDLQTGVATLRADFHGWSSPLRDFYNWAVTTAARNQDHLISIEDVTGTTGHDNIIGDANNNTLIGNGGNDTLNGNDGDDILRGNGGTDELYGGSNDDLLIGGRGNDILNGGAGIDAVDYRYSDGILEVDLAAGRGEIIAVPGNDGGWLPVEDTDVLVDIENVIGSSGPSNIYGDDLANDLSGWGGFNNLYGRGGNDTLWGGDDRNWLYGGEGDDVLRGGASEDWLDGGTGADKMQGFGGDDVYVVDRSEDTIFEFGDGGTDRVRTATISYLLPDNVENLELLGNAWLHGIGNTLDNVIVGNRAPNALFGRDGNDTLDGGGESDGLYGGNGDDSILGGDGPDKVYGGDGDDRLDGGLGNDILTGKTGSDAFLFVGGHGIDAIRDFDVTADHLEIAGGFWAIEMMDGTFDGILDDRDANVFYGIPSRNDTYYPAYDGPPDEADSYGMNIITGGGIIHLDNVFALTADDIWDLA